jgi:hypothetical protein
MKQVPAHMRAAVMVVTIIKKGRRPDPQQFYLPANAAHRAKY